MGDEQRLRSSDRRAIVNVVRRRLRLWPGLFYLILCSGVLAAVLWHAVVRASETDGLHLQTGPVSSQVGDLLWFSLLCALLASATIELAKRLTYARGRLQMRLVWVWLSQRARYADVRINVPPVVAFAQLMDAVSGSSSEPSALSVDDADAYPRWPPLALRAGLQPTAFRRYAAFDAPPDQLVAQVATAVDLAISDPYEYEPLLVALVGRELPRKLRRESKPPTSREDPPRLDRREVADAQRIQAALDALQLRLVSVWRRLVQLSAVTLAGLYGIGLVWAAGLTEHEQARYLFAAVVLGGPGSWLVRDVTAVLERWRG